MYIHIPPSCSCPLSLWCESCKNYSTMQRRVRTIPRQYQVIMNARNIWPQLHCKPNCDKNAQQLERHASVVGNIWTSNKVYPRDITPTIYMILWLKSGQTFETLTNESCQNIHFGYTEVWVDFSAVTLLISHYLLDIVTSLIEKLRSKLYIED
jgi:hypothetical protein